MAEDKKVNIPTPVNLQENIAKAQKIYADLGEEFIKTNNGKFIAIEVESGEYFVGETREEAVKLSNQKYKNRLVFTRRIGNLEKIASHSPLGFGKANYASYI